MLFFGMLLSGCLVIKSKKQYEAEVAERNRLRRSLRDCERQASILRADTSKLGKELRQLRREYAELEEQSTMTNAQLSEQLRQKAAALNDKDILLQEREARLKELQDIISRQREASERLLSKLQDVLKGFPEDELSLELKNGKVYVSLSDKLLFRSGSAAVDKKGKEALEKLARELRKNPDIEILVEGHTDDVPIKTGRFADNWDLSVIRATSIVRLLTESYKIDPKRLTPSGRGEFFPVATNETKDGRALNRRTEIILSPKLDELFDFLEQESIDEEN